MIRPHLDYGDIVYDRAFNEPFHKNLESIQYNAAIAITGAIGGTSSEKLFQELGLESLKSLTLLTRLQLGLSHLGDHKFRYNFQDFVSPMCSCGQDIETTTHFLLHCPNHHCARKTLFHKINQVKWKHLKTE